MTDVDVNVSWREIEKWLAAHAPTRLVHLNPPAAQGEIDAAARALGKPLPAELVLSLKCHNGLRRGSTVLPEGTPLSAAAIVQRWQTCMDVAADNDGFEPMPWAEEPWWHPLWIPWAESADGHLQVIDLRPGERCGQLGWAGFSCGGDFVDAWPNLPTLLGAIATAFRHGRDVLGLHPHLTEDGDVWWAESDDGASQSQR